MKLLLPYAYDSKRELVHIDQAKKGERYTCPNCDAELLLRIGKIPEGQKYHKRNHFAHKGNSDNHCSESFLHKLFKERCVEFIRQKIADNENIQFEWHCEKCEEEHTGNLLKKAVRVEPERDLEKCKPDIALLDKDGNVVIVVEVVVTHKPEPEVMQYYDDKKIACLQLQVDDFPDCDRIEEKLSHPEHMNICPNPRCKKCGEIMLHAQMVTVAAKCRRCGEEMKVAMLSAKNGHYLLGPAYFNDQEIKMAMDMGANLEKRYSKTMNETYLANVCKKCLSFIGKFYIHNYYYAPHTNEKDLDDCKCFSCIEAEEQQKELQIYRESEQLEELAIREGNKLCPRCGGRLVIRNSYRGPFWGCQNFPECTYTENIRFTD